MKEATSGGEYTESSLKLDPMDARKRWLMFEFVGSNNPSIKLSNLSGPNSARGIEVYMGDVDRLLQSAVARTVNME